MSHITLNTTIHEIFHHPEIGALNQYLISLPRVVDTIRSVT